MEELFKKKNNCPNCSKHTPKESYYFIPSESDCVVFNPSYPTKILRLIFEKKNKDEYLPYEKEMFEKFTEYFEKNLKSTFKLPNDWTESETRKCLQASLYDMEKTFEKMKAEINYKIPNLPFTDFEEILSRKFLYMHGLDINYRPILITNAKIFMDLIDKYPIENFIVAIDKMIIYLKEHFFIKGQVENWVMIADLNGVSIWSPPIKMIKIFDFLQVKYLCRLKSLYIYGMGYVLNFCWKIIKKLIDERTAEKFNFINNQSDIDEYVLKNIHPSQLEKKYGGQADDLDEVIDFPFILSSNIYQYDYNRNNIISEDEYIRRAKNNDLCEISPYLENEINGDSKLKSKHKIIDNSSKEPIIYNNIEFYECESFDDSYNQNNNDNIIFIDINEVKTDDINNDQKSYKTNATDLKTENNICKNNNNKNNSKFKSGNKLNNIRKNSILLEKEEINGGCCKGGCTVF